VESAEDAEKIFADMQIEVDRYGVSPRFVSKRELNIMEGVFSQEDKTFTTETLPAIYANLTDNYQGIDLLSRLAIYEKLVIEVMEHWYLKRDTLPDDIIHATCTGYLSPSLFKNYCLLKVGRM